MKIKLWDVENYEYPKDGEYFRTLQVFQCGICGSLINKVIRCNDADIGVQPLCPNEVEYWHYQLKTKIKLLHAAPHPASYVKELEEEIKAGLMKASCKAVRDLAGKPDMESKRFMF